MDTMSTARQDQMRAELNQLVQRWARQLDEAAPDDRTSASATPDPVARRRSQLARMTAGEHMRELLTGLIATSAADATLYGAGYPSWERRSASAVRRPASGGRTWRPRSAGIAGVPGSSRPAVSDGPRTAAWATRAASSPYRRASTGSASRSAGRAAVCGSPWRRRRPPTRCTTRIRARWHSCTAGTGLEVATDRPQTVALRKTGSGPAHPGPATGS